MFSFSFETVWLLLWLLLLLNMPSLLFYFQALFRSQCFFFNSINTQIKGTTNQRTKQINIIVYEYAVILVIHNYGVYVSLSPSLSLARDITWLSLSLARSLSLFAYALLWCEHSTNSTFEATKAAAKLPARQRFVQFEYHLWVLTNEQEWEYWEHVMNVSVTESCRLRLKKKQE